MAIVDIRLRSSLSVCLYKYDAVHKTESTLRIKTPPEEDRAMVVGSMHKIGEDWIVVDEDWICSSGDILADRQTRGPLHTHRLTRHNTLFHYRG